MLCNGCGVRVIGGTILKMSLKSCPQTLHIVFIWDAESGMRHLMVDQLASYLFIDFVVFFTRDKKKMSLNVCLDILPECRVWPI